jgi:NhaP-type Na+/H+ or K+/H+ antiporter
MYSISHISRDGSSVDAKGFLQEKHSIMWVNLLLVLLCWIAAGLVLGMVFGWMIAFADKASADEPNQLARFLQEADAHSTTPYRAVGGSLR